ncbi:MAG: CpsD/CapB family tyrosine-protein kinase [Phycisphaerae bacterium]|nr:CpsD/CapB family tyrosine-protein kinase [Phycisphaerae bacterium]
MGRIADAIKKAKDERERRQRTADAIVNMPGAAPAMESLTSNSDAANEPPLSGSAPNSGSTPIPGATEAERFAIGSSAVWDVHPTVVAVMERSSIITEQYRAARTWLLRRYSPSKMNCVAITSSLPREGKSVTTANLAAVMAEVRHMNVLAMDCDFRQCSMAKLFKMPNSPGLSDVLSGRATLNDAIQRTPLGNLYILTGGGSRDVNSTELLASRSAAKVFDEIRERFHYTLVDTPPVQCLSDVGVIGALCSGIVMVVRMNKTASHVVRQSLHRLQANNLPVLGCIAADCSVKGARYEYDGKDHN